MEAGVKQLLELRKDAAESANPVHSEGDWRYQWSRRARTAAEVLALRPELKERLEGRAAGFQAHEFRFGVTPYYLGLADPADPHCPILKQILPDEKELTDPVFHRPDPLAEETHMPVRGLTHRYPDRVLWYLSHNCAVYCRFCMRKRKVSRADSGPGRTEWEAALEYINNHTEIKEVILSGGDPLSLSDRRLDETLTRLRRVSHLHSIRIHTRMPVTMPMRITPELAAIFREAYPLTLVTHFNHARELTKAAGECVRLLRMNGVLVLNQAVLMRGINDATAAQEALHLGLIRLGVKPYYLHQCDEVRGVSHFRVPIERGLEIMRELRGRNPGISLPRYVLDLPGGGGKVPLENDYRIGEGENANRFRNWKGDEYEIAPMDD